MKRTSILLVEDDESIQLLLRLYLEKEGYRILTATDGKEGLQIWDAEKPSLVLLDLMLPGMDGVSVCKAIRRRSDTPIIMLTAKSQSHDKVEGLELGADDYITKPFDPPELVARVRAVLRRKMEKGLNPRLEFEGLLIDRETFEVRVEGESISLPLKEMDLLCFLAAHPNQVFNREQILERVWGLDFMGDNRTVDVHIKRLREKIEKPDLPWGIRTVWGVGYKFEVTEYA